jgi:hypothetical protein
MGERMSTDAELRERVSRLEDRAAIQVCMQRYARGMDRRDGELLRSAYHDRTDPSYDRPLAASRADASS